MSADATQDAKVLTARIALRIKNGKMPKAGALEALQALSVKADREGWDGAFQVFASAAQRLG